MTQGYQMLERAFYMRDRLGTRAAAMWLEKQGMKFGLGIIALVGSQRAKHYGVEVGRICGRPKW